MARRCICTSTPNSLASSGVEKALVVMNGEMVVLAPRRARRSSTQMPHGRMLLDGNVLVLVRMTNRRPRAQQLAFRASFRSRSRLREGRDLLGDPDVMIAGMPQLARRRGRAMDEIVDKAIFKRIDTLLARAAAIPTRGERHRAFRALGRRRGLGQEAAITSVRG